MSKIQSAAEEYSSVYVYQASNMRSQLIHGIRENWEDSKIVFGKNKVVQVALGRTPAEETQDNIHKVSQRLAGPCMLLFTNRPRAEVEAYFDSFRAQEYARMGMVVTQDVDVEAGPLPQFAHSQEPYLRQLGLPTRLIRATVTLERDFRICKKGDKLTSEQAKLLKAFGMQLAEVSFRLDSVWTQGNFELVGAMDLGEDGSEQEDEEYEEMDQSNDEEEEEQVGGKKQRSKK